MIVDVVLPAWNEEGAVGVVVRGLRATGRVRHIVVADNASTDRTAERAREAGAIVVYEAERGYGAACLAAIERLRSHPPEVVVFIDGDGSDDPDDLAALLVPFERGADLVIGSRVLGRRERGALSVQQRVGNAIACAAIRARYGIPATDLGPFRAIRWATLERLQMRDKNWGWTVEMQLRAARAGCVIHEVPVRYRRRLAGTSKVSGTLRGAVGAGYKITRLLVEHALSRGDAAR